MALLTVLLAVLCVSPVMNPPPKKNREKKEKKYTQNTHVWLCQRCCWLYSLRFNALQAIRSIFIAGQRNTRRVSNQALTHVTRRLQAHVCGSGCASTAAAAAAALLPRVATLPPPQRRESRRADVPPSSALLRDTQHTSKKNEIEIEKIEKTEQNRKKIEL